VAYAEALQAAGMGIVKAYPPAAREMDEATLRAWAGVLGAVRPSLRQRPFTHQLSGWAHYLVYQWRARRSPTKDRLHYFTPTTERQQLETAVLLWSGGELFLIANKVS
jgi:hypothetical protein